MKANRDLIYKLILEEMSKESSWSDINELGAWFSEQTKEGVRKIKTGEGDFNY